MKEKISRCVFILKKSSPKKYWLKDQRLIWTPKFGQEFRSFSLLLTKYAYVNILGEKSIKLASLATIKYPFIRWDSLSKQRVNPFMIISAAEIGEVKDKPEDKKIANKLSIYNENEERWK